MEIPGIGTKRCHAVATNADAFAVSLSGRHSQNVLKMLCGTSTGADNSYVKNGDVIQVEFGLAGDIAIFKNDKCIATGIFLKYGDKLHYTVKRQ